MVIQFTLQDLMLFLVCALGIVAGILLLSILWNIKKTIRTMPGIFDNVEQISSNVRETTDKLKVSVPVIMQEVECVTNTAKDSSELAKKDAPGFMAYIHIIEEVLQIIYRTFSSTK